MTGHATTYLRWACSASRRCWSCSPATGILRGLQDTRTPLVVAVGGNVANVVLNVLLVYGLDLGHRRLRDRHRPRPARLRRGARGRRGPRRPPRRVRRCGPTCPGVRRAAHAGVALVVRTLTLRASPAGDDVRRRHARRDRHRRPAARHDAVDVPGLRPGRDRDRRPGDHRPLPRRRRPRGHPRGHRPDGPVGLAVRRRHRRAARAVRPAARAACSPTTRPCTRPCGRCCWSRRSSSRVAGRGLRPRRGPHRRRGRPLPRLGRARSCSRCSRPWPGWRSRRVARPRARGALGGVRRRVHGQPGASSCTGAPAAAPGWSPAYRHGRRLPP